MEQYKSSNYNNILYRMKRTEGEFRGRHDFIKLVLARNVAAVVDDVDDVDDVDILFNVL